MIIFKWIEKIDWIIGKREWEMGGFRMGWCKLAIDLIYCGCFTYLFIRNLMKIGYWGGNINNIYH